MPPIRSSTAIAQKYQTVTPARATEYEQGVRSPLGDWEKNTLAANATYKAALAASIAADSFARGVTAAGNESWQEGATTKGPGRFAEGVAQAGQAYQEGFSPYRDAIERTVLPPRGPKGSPQNIQRVAALATALHTLKLKG